MLVGPSWNCKSEGTAEAKPWSCGAGVEGGCESESELELELEIVGETVDEILWREIGGSATGG